MRRPRSAISAVGLLAAVLGSARTAVWMLALNCLQNRLTAPRAVGARADSPHAQTDHPRPLVSVLIPARDEASNIGPCLRGLLVQAYPLTEILVCDDRSTDGTAEIVRRIANERGGDRLRLIVGAERPPGWSGKNWACHQLAEAARGDWLLFLDADTRARPHLVGALLALVNAYGADLLSLLPRHETGTLGERLLVSQIPLIARAILPIALVPGRSRWTRSFAGANGLCLCFRREWYNRLGGYPTVRAVIAEDMRFAFETKRLGGRLVLADGTAVLACRMYRGFAETWRGMSRNAFPAALESTTISATFAAIWALCFVLPPIALAASVAATLAGRGTAWSLVRRLAAEATAGQIIVRYLTDQPAGRPAREALLQPASSVLALGILLNSYRLHRLGGGFDWRGRRYAPPPLRRTSSISCGAPEDAC